jgi:hypothetical protein
MPKKLVKNVWARALPSMMLALDFVTVVAVALVVLWLVVVWPVNALAQNAPRQQADGNSASAPNAAPQIIPGSTIDIDGKSAPARPI